MRARLRTNGHPAAMIEGAAEGVVLADQDKLGTAMPSGVAPLGAVTHLVTDADANKRSPGA